jgi:hypothetical protein
MRAVKRTTPAAVPLLLLRLRGSAGACRPFGRVDNV